MKPGTGPILASSLVQTHVSPGEGDQQAGLWKGSHRKFAHDKYAGAVTLSGSSGDDAKPYQEKNVRQAIEEVQE